MPERRTSSGTESVGQLAIRVGVRFLRGLRLEFAAEFVTPIGTHCHPGHRVVVQDFAIFGGEPAVRVRHLRSPLSTFERGGLLEAEWVYVSQLVSVVRLVRVAR